MPPEPLPSLEDGEFFVDQTFSELALGAVDLSGKELQRCVFRRCKLAESRWARTKLEDCVFEDCDLSRIVARSLALRGVTFKGSKLMGVDFTDLSPLPQVTFEGCDLRYASFVKLRLRATRIVGCLAREANFLDVDLTEADFTDTDLTGAVIRGCALGKANLSRATGVAFDPQINKVKGARIGVEAALSLVQSLGIVIE